MHRTAWLIGDVADSILDSLTAPAGYPPAEIWVPLESTAAAHPHRMPRYRSAWAFRTRGGEQWLEFALPADTIMEAVGPHALAYPGTLTHTKALASHTKTREGVFMAKVPRYFTTVATSWASSESQPLRLKGKREAAAATLGDLDLRNYTGHNHEIKPSLLIGPDGPLLLTRVHPNPRFYNVSCFLSAGRVLSALRKLPPETSIRSITYTE
ncbi:MAG: hypothetical protein MUF33_06600 [Candidatus Nanopelagicales bacterium]|jgi:hypothetical protein|nr:hypothetical protein [Candidatus Nanopelagicales bacterium]